MDLAYGFELEAKEVKVFKRLSRIVQLDLEAYLLFQTHLTGVRDDLETRGPVFEGATFSVLNRLSDEPRHLEALTALMQDGGLLTADNVKAKSALEERLYRGDACAIAWDGNTAIGCAWIAGSNSHVRKQFAQCANRFPGAAVLYQAFVDRRYRGRQLHILLDRVRKDYVRSSGGAETLTFVGVTNFASVRNSMRVNHEFKLIYHLAVKGPKGIVGNFYLKWSHEPWNCCEQEPTRTRKVEDLK